MSRSKIFREGYDAFPFEGRDPKGLIAGFATFFDQKYCPYVKPMGMAYEKAVRESDWAEWWKGYKAAAVEDEEEFLNTDYLALEEIV